VTERARDVREDVHARDVHRAERRALRPADRRTGDRVDLLDRVIAGLERREHLHQPEHADAVGDEARDVLREHDALAEAHVGERVTSATTCGIGLRRGISSSRCR
jgi:hypothetical protein